MAFREYTIPSDTEWSPDGLADYLKENGFLFGPGGIATGVTSTDDGMAVVVRLDVDANLPDEIVLSSLQAYEPPVDPLRIAKGYLMKRAKALRAIPSKDRTQSDNDLLAVIVVLGMGG